jgi:hypothetical protein
MYVSLYIVGMCRFILSNTFEDGQMHSPLFFTAYETKYLRGYCHVDAQQWIAGYEYPFKSSSI